MKTCRDKKPVIVADIEKYGLGSQTTGRTDTQTDRHTETIHNRPIERAGEGSHEGNEASREMVGR